MTINEIDDTFVWNYVACERCQKKVTKERDQYTCRECKQTPKYQQEGLIFVYNELFFIT